MNDGKKAEFTLSDQTFISFHYLKALTQYSGCECVSGGWMLCGRAVWRPAASAGSPEFFSEI